MDKVISAAAALATVGDGATLAVGGFGLCGIPSALIATLHRTGVTDLRVCPTTVVPDHRVTTGHAPSPTRGARRS
ncbi:hypothetical protein LWC35_22155 [Pseudonocardia kujensis]|uniref:CoA-transferase n=1 Tax=Pseudonocardia kujensis TaxID=1128675 RepID=UPI001E559850|nr:CoA-transferase [Pseudonocardia kujensis]MCE0765586.1 hypothetical protein [Pseudonocardia kujensis]